jgi:hypothetical protein
MKTFLIIVATAAITWFSFSIVQSLRTGVERLWMISAVKVPGNMALKEIQSDMSAGRFESARAKINGFADTWQRFNSGPDSCSGLGIGDILVTFSKLDTNYTATTPEPDGAANRSQPVTAGTNRPSLPAGSGR